MNDYGVIVGRFQVQELHEGHKTLLAKVRMYNKTAIIFLASPRTGPTLRNPLDFKTRRRMLLAEVPLAIILPIYDQKSDETWNTTLDSKIEEITNSSKSVTLYGGRGSFLTTYKGRYPTQELKFSFVHAESGVKVRAGAANKIPDSADSRSGAIYAIANQRKRAFFTVDGAVLYNIGKNLVPLVLLGRKLKEQNFRFPGGFVEMGESLETAVKREIYEETNRDINSLEYIGSFPIDDWRYRQDSDAKITTVLFAVWSNSLSIQPADDLAECHWFPIDNMPKLEPEHEKLKTALLEYLHKKGLYADYIPPQSVEIIG